MAIEMLTQLAVNLIDAQVRQLITARRVQVDTEESLSRDELQAKIREQLAAICLDHSLSLAIDDGLMFEQFFLEHYETVRQRVYAAGLDLELAEDVTQNAMIIALQYWERISVMESPIAYVTTTAINLLRRVRRKEAAALHVEPRKINPDRWLKTTTAGFEDVLTTRLILEQALRVIPQEQAECFVLHHVFQYPFHEIATDLGIPPGTVKSRTHAACMKLREILGDDTTGGLR